MVKIKAFKIEASYRPHPQPLSKGEGGWISKVEHILF